MLQSSILPHTTVHSEFANISAIILGSTMFGGVSCEEIVTLVLHPTEVARANCFDHDGHAGRVADHGVDSLENAASL